MLDVRNDFPIFHTRPELCYLDSAATSQKPERVIESVIQFLSCDNGTVRRGIHRLGDVAETAFEEARKKVARFIGAKPHEIVFTQNATASLNTVARGFARNHAEGPVLLSFWEHNSNILPWFHVGMVRYFSPYTVIAVPNDARIISMTHLSNVVGIPTPVKGVSRIAKEAGVPMMVDAAQSIGHMRVNVEELDVDFLAFSAHKMLGLTGLGVLYIHEAWKKQFAPVFIGGGTVSEVNEHGYNWLDPPAGLEAGTPPVVEAIALGAAIEYLESLGMEQIEAHIHDLTHYCCNRLYGLGIEPIGGPDKHGLVSFNLDQIHPHDVAYELDKLNIAVRAGHHCAHLCHKVYNVNGSVRASFHVYNTRADVDRLIEGLIHVRQTFGD